MTITTATETVAILNADPEEDWTYRVVVINEDRGYAKIEIFNEDGEYVGDLD